MMTWLKAEVKDIGKDTDKLLEREVLVLKKEIEELRRKVNLNDDIELKAFEAMEAEVKSDADVKLAKDALAKEKTKAITSLCMQYPGFASAYADYKSKVYEAHQKMQKGE